MSFTLIETIDNEISDITNQIQIAEANVTNYGLTKIQFNIDIDAQIQSENDKATTLNAHLSNLNQIKTILQNQ